jgi:transcriptional regulator with XRE-family HTH domain
MLGSPHAAEEVLQINRQALLAGVGDQFDGVLVRDQSAGAALLSRVHPAVDPRLVHAGYGGHGIDALVQSPIGASKLQDQVVSRVQMLALPHASHIAEIAIQCQETLDIRNSDVAIFQRRAYCASVRWRYSSPPWCIKVRGDASVAGTKKMGKYPEQAILSEWLDRGLRKRGKSAKELAARLGILTSAVSRMRKNSQLFKVHELQPIADYIEEPAPVPAGGHAANAGSSSESAARGTLGSETAVPPIRVTSVIAVGVWREVGAPVMVLAERAPASPDPRLKGIRQYACKIEAEPNRYAVCVPYQDMRQRPLNGDVVHVRRTRQGQYEDTLRVVRIVNGQIRLHLKGDEKNKDGTIAFPAAKGEDVEIRGLVVGYHEIEQF